MWGYRGSDTEPNCTPSFCWYFNYPAQTIKQETLDKLKMEGVEFNNREVNLGANPLYNFVSNGLLYTPPTDDSPNTELWTYSTSKFLENLHNAFAVKSWGQARLFFNHLDEI